MSSRSGLIVVSRVIGVASSLLAASVTSASAAVRQCAPVITATATDQKDEQSARRNAVIAWTNAARQLGPQYTSWRLAVDRSASCSKIEDTTGYLCKVIAAPCTIQQNPNLAPPITKNNPNTKPATGISL
jgi:hypothetical protein